MITEGANKGKNREKGISSVSNIPQKQSSYQSATLPCLYIRSELHKQNLHYTGLDTPCFHVRLLSRLTLAANVTSMTTPFLSRGRHLLSHDKRSFRDSLKAFTIDKTQ